MKIRVHIRYTILAVAVLLAIAGFSAEASGFDLFGALPKTYVSCTKKRPKILFVGNSFTQKHNMPLMFQKLCRKRGIHPVIQTVTKGSHSLYEYMFPDRKNAEDVQLSRRLKQLLKTKKWDYVVLQDRSYEAVANPEKMRRAVKELSGLIKKADAKMVLYMTWAPKKGHLAYRKYVRGLVSSPDEYLAKVQKMYYALAEKYHAALAPVGIAFRRVQKSSSDIRVIGSDNLHASVQGAYLTACVFYATIFGESPEGIAYYPKAGNGIEGISANTAAKLQKLAANVTVRGGLGSAGKPKVPVSDKIVQNGKSKKLK